MGVHSVWDSETFPPENPDSLGAFAASEGSPDYAQQELVRCLSQGKLLEDGGGGVEVLETHISYVFLTARSAYKLKKAVRFPFVDLSTLEKRYQSCRAEVELNRRLAPQVYLGVVPVRRHGEGSFRLGGSRGPVVDYLVHMRRLPRERMLDRLIARGEIAPGEVEPLLELLVRFYTNLAPCMLRPEQYLNRFQHWVDDNAQSLEQLLTGSLRPLAAAAQTAQRLFLKLGAEQLRRRVCDGRIVEGHGDLRPEHICLIQPPVVFDCLEFSLPLRQVDVADEVSFLEVECEVLGSPELGRRVRNRVLQACGDRPGGKLLAFYKSYRACVRAKVNALAMQQHAGQDSARQELLHRYLHAAAAHGRQIAPPLLLVVRGASGSGKSTLARALAQELALPLASTDELRCRLFGEHPPAADWGQGIYTAENRRRVYEELFAQAGRLLEQAGGVVLDGTFLESEPLAGAERLARQAGALPVAITCQCAESVARARIRNRLQQGSDPSRATVQVRSRQPQPSPAPFAEIQVDTAAPFAQELKTVWSHLQSLLKL